VLRLATRKHLQFQSGFDHGQRFPAHHFHKAAPAQGSKSRRWFTSFGASFAGIILLGGASRRRMKPGRGARTVLTLTAFAFLLMVAGCGGGSSGGGGHNQDPGTPAGSSVVTVTATSGTITHSVAFTLTVQ
jgi:hypothetical protein